MKLITSKEYIPRHDNKWCVFYYQVKDLTVKLKEKDKEIKRLREALKLLYDETANYITINKLGTVHHNRSMQLAKEALKSKNELLK